MRYVYFIGILLLVPIFSWAQLSVVKPLMSDNIISSSDINSVSPVIHDLDEAIAEEESESKDLPPRFGIPWIGDIDFYSEASIDYLPGNRVLHRLSVKAKGAKSLNFIFSEFDLPEGAWMHIYNKDRSQIIGAFTEENESSEYAFATVPLKGDEIIIEVFHPTSDLSGKIRIGSIIYGYKDIFSSDKTFGSSGGCNINVACQEGNAWRDQIRSVVMIITGTSNNRFCTGSMINNVREDGRAFMLTAQHCNIAASNIAVFNYQSAQCSPTTDSSFAHSINGLTILATSGESDFRLTELSSKPPKSFNAYYSGWNSLGDIPQNTVGIHHPQGDVKKISFDFDRSVSSGYYTHGDNHWMVESWDMGTTEVISSGSPLFDERKQIVGQLHGGDASCDDPDKEDYYGKFSVSWDFHSASNKQLKYWLDPDNSGASNMPGIDLNKNKDDKNIAIVGFRDFNSTYCRTDFTGPSGMDIDVVVKNRGSDTIFNYTLTTFINGNQKLTYNETTSLEPGKTEIATVNVNGLVNGFYDLSVEASLQFPENDISDNVLSTEIKYADEGYEVELIIKTDNAGSETSWNLTSATGEIFYKGGGYESITGGEIILDTFCLFPSCYNLIFFDDWGDGMCCDFGQGYYLLRKTSNLDTIVFNDNFTGSDTSHFFCVGDSCSISARGLVTPSTSSSSGDGSIEIEMISGIPPFTFDWSNNETTQNIYDLDPGVYTVYIVDSIGCFQWIEWEVPVSTGVVSGKAPDSEISVYPNPSNGSMKISGLKTGQEYNVKLYDLRGRMIQERLILSARNVEQINFDLRIEGMYILRITAEEEMITKRIVIDL